MSFDAGDANITRHVFNIPITASDPSGLGFFSDLFDSVGDFFKDVGDFVEDAWKSVAEYTIDPFVEQFERFGHFVEDAVEDTGDFFEEQWENGNIQKALLAASVVVSAGAFAPIAAGGFAGLASMSTGALLSAAGTTVQFASAAVSSYEVFSGDQIGDGTLGRVLGAASAISGGFSGGLPGSGQWFANPANVLGAADGLVSGYEIAKGDTIGDGTLSSILNVASIGSQTHKSIFGPKHINGGAHWTERVGDGLRLSASVGSAVSTGDPNLQRALRGISIASSLWQVGSTASLIPGVKELCAGIYDAGATLVGRVRKALAPREAVGNAYRVTLESCV